VAVVATLLIDHFVAAVVAAGQAQRASWWLRVPEFTMRTSSMDGNPVRTLFGLLGLFVERLVRRYPMPFSICERAKLLFYKRGWSGPIIIGSQRAVVNRCNGDSSFIVKIKKNPGGPAPLGGPTWGGFEKNRRTANHPCDKARTGS